MSFTMNVEHSAQSQKAQGMTLDQQELMMRGAVAMLPEEDQVHYKELEKKIMSFVEVEGELGAMAVVLVTVAMARKYS